MLLHAYGDRCGQSLRFHWLVWQLCFFWWWVGVYTIVFTLILTRSISTFVSLHFTSRSQKNLQYPEIVFPSLKEFVVFLRKLTSWEFFAAALAFSVIDISGILIGLLSLTHHAPIFAGSAFILFYFINPLLKPDSDWALLFYFDLKKFQGTELEPFLPMLTKKVLLISPVIGLFFWCMAIIATAGYFHQDVYLISLIFFVLFTLRASNAMSSATQ